MKRSILTVNAGSSSIKIDVVDAESLGVVASGSKSFYGIDKTAAVHAALGDLQSEADLSGVVAVGHRIVHGGNKFHGPTQINYDNEQILKSLVQLAPEHMATAIECMDIFRQQFSQVPHVACFDTTFFADIPAEARLLPIPRKYQQSGLTRYGFHGLSYEYLLNTFKSIAGEQAANGRVIMAHLGSGCSLTALYGGRPIDMTMGFSPVSGVMMSTRSGDLDPEVIAYLMSEFSLSIEDVMNVVNTQSGLFGVSELSPDMLTLLENEQFDPRSREAVSMFVRSIVKTIGAYAGLLGGVDSIIFSGGIGEASAPIRARVCSILGYLGVEIDQNRNEQNAELISSDNSRVGVHVIATKESVTVASQTLQVIGVQNA